MVDGLCKLSVNLLYFCKTLPAYDLYTKTFDSSKRGYSIEVDRVGCDKDAARVPETSQS